MYFFRISYHNWNEFVFSVTRLCTVQALACIPQEAQSINDVTSQRSLSNNFWSTLPGWYPLKCWRVSWPVLELPTLTMSPQVCLVSESCLSFRKYRWLSPAQTYWYTISRPGPAPLLGTNASQHRPPLFLLLFPLPQSPRPAPSIQHHLSLARLLLGPKPLTPAIFPGQHHLDVPIGTSDQHSFGVLRGCP